LKAFSLHAFANGKKLISDANAGEFGELDLRSGFGSSNDNNGMIDVSNLMSPMNQTTGHNLK
jgi:hypothetical protein